MSRKRLTSSVVLGFNPVALALCAAVMYGSAPAGFNWIFGSSKDAIEQAVQRMKPRPGPFTDARRPANLGTHPWRDPEHLTDRWTPKLRQSLAKVQRQEAEKRNSSRWADLSAVVFSLRTIEETPLFLEGGATITTGGTTTTSSTTTGGTSGGGPGGFTTGMNDLNSRTGNRLTRQPITGWSSAGDSRVSFTLYHNSMGGEYLADVGASWSHSYGIKIDEDPGVSAIVRWADGTRHPYEYDAGDYVPPPGVHDSLVKNGNGTWTLTTKHGSVLQFDTSERLTSVADKFGNAVTLTRNGSGQITAVTDEDSRAPEFTYDDGLIATVTDPLDRVWEFTYNAYDQLTGITYPDLDATAHTRTFTYDGNDNILTETDLEGEVWTFTYDGDDRETSFTDPLTNEWEFSYTSNSATMEDPLGNDTTHNYSLGMVVSTVDAASYSDAYEWDSDKNLVEYTDRRGKVWTATYDGDGNMLTVTDPLSRTWTYTYNANNFLTSVEDPLENLTVIGYDGGGIKPLTITDPLDRTVATLTYDGDGDLLTVEDALEHVTEYTYDAYKNVMAVTAPDGTEVSADYNLVGWVESVLDAASDETLVSYDEWGRIVAIEHSDESTVTIAYNLEGLIVSATDELDRTGYRTYDDALRLVGTLNARGDAQSVTYNAAGWVTEVENGRGYSRLYTYTVRGEVYTLELPDESLESWAYDAEGNTSSYTNALSQTISYSYNDAGDLTLINYPTGTDTSFSYDGAGRTVSMTDATGTSEWTFNAAGEVTALETPQGDLEYVYNLAGQVTEMTADESEVTEYAYDAYGRFSSLTNPFDETTSVTYDAAGRVNRKDFDSGVYETFAYDDRSRPTLILVKDSGNAEIDRKEYVWDDASRVTSAKEGGYWSYYEYDEVDQLIEEEKPGLSYLATYTYDDNGNRLTRTVNSVTETYAYDEADKLETVSVNSSVVKEYTYDAAGRTTAIEANSQTTTFAYDYEGRITGITYPSTSTDSFGYNGLGARTSTSGTNGSRTFFRNGLSVTAPVLGDSSADYTPGVSLRASSATKFSHAGLKNTSTQSAENETVSASRSYDAFGNVSSSSGTWSSPFGYSGGYGYQEDPNGLKLLGHRYLDSSTGRFLTQDPIGDGDNWYRYADNNPVTGVDPTGLKTFFKGYWDHFWGDPWGRLTGMLAPLQVYNGGKFWVRVFDEGLGVIGEEVEAIVKSRTDVLNSDDPYAQGQAAATIAEDLVMLLIGWKGIGPKGSGAKCFVAGTMVLLASGASVPIEDVRVGDMVLSYDERSGETVAAPVTQTFVSEAGETVTVSFTDGDSFEATPEHPFYVFGKGWVEAGDLAQGSLVRSKTGLPTAVASVSSSSKATVTVYNLTVAGTHNYFVGDGKLVHNQTCRNPYGSRGGPDHQAPLPGIEAAEKSLGNEHLSGGSLPERVLPGSGRRPDAMFVTPVGTLRLYNIGKRGKRGNPLAREVDAAGDLAEFGEVFFIPYN